MKDLKKKESLMKCEASQSLPCSALSQSRDNEALIHRDEWELWARGSQPCSGVLWVKLSK